jgi:predicted GIY-YIG superfamily endonuclease
MYYVYLLKSKKFINQVYIGFTTNVENRLYVHNAGGSIHTARYKPWLLHAYFAFHSKKQALAFEEYLKSHSGRAFANKRFWQ